MGAKWSRRCCYDGVVTAGAVGCVCACARKKKKKEKGNVTRIVMYDVLISINSIPHTHIVLPPSLLSFHLCVRLCSPLFDSYCLLPLFTFTLSRSSSWLPPPCPATHNWMASLNLPLNQTPPLPSIPLSINPPARSLLYFPPVLNPLYLALRPRAPMAAPYSTSPLA